MTHVAIMAWDGSNRVTKYQDFETEAMALAHVAGNVERFPNAFVGEAPAGDAADWMVSNGALISSPPLAGLKARKSAAIDKAFQAKINAGFMHGGHIYQLGPDKFGRWAMDNITAKGAEAGIILANTPGAEPWPADFVFVDAANASVPLDAEAMLAMAQAASAYVTALRLNYRALKTANAVAADVAAVAAVNENTGWP
jgi:hypothetical protein